MVRPFRFWLNIVLLTLLAHFWFIATPTIQPSLPAGSSYFQAPNTTIQPQNTFQIPGSAHPVFPYAPLGPLGTPSDPRISAFTTQNTAYHPSTTINHNAHTVPLLTSHTQSNAAPGYSTSQLVVGPASSSHPGAVSSPLVPVLATNATSTSNPSAPAHLPNVVMGPGILTIDSEYRSQLLGNGGRLNLND